MSDKVKTEYYSSISTQNKFSSSDKLLRVEHSPKIRTVFLNDKFVGAIEATTASDEVLAALFISYETLLREKSQIDTKK